MINSKIVNSETSDILTKEEYINYISLKMTLEYYRTTEPSDRCALDKIKERADLFKQYILTGNYLI